MGDSNAVPMVACAQVEDRVGPVSLKDRGDALGVGQKVPTSSATSASIPSRARRDRRVLARSKLTTSWPRSSRSLASQEPPNPAPLTRAFGPSP